jgi:predicted small secreted protein
MTESVRVLTARLAPVALFLLTMILAACQKTGGSGY